MQPRPAGAPSDAEILEKAYTYIYCDKLAALLAGDWQAYAASHSEADLALCNLLAFWLGADKARMDAAFRASGLFRPKWDQRRGADTYGNITLARALAECQEVYDPTPAPPQVPAEEAKAEVADLLRSMGITPSKKPEQAPVPAAPAPGRKTYSLDDTGNARRFRDQYGDKVRYNYTQGCWMIWTGQVWRRDETAAVKQMCDAMLDGMEKACSVSMTPSRRPPCANSSRKAAAATPRTTCLKKPST